MFVVVVVLTILYRLFVVFLSIVGLFLSKKKLHMDVGKDLIHEYVFLFPVYKEQKIIRETLAYYENFLKRSEKISMLFITTCKEKGSDSTGVLLEKLIKNSPLASRMNVIESPSLVGTKATQLNIGLEYLKKKKAQLPYLMCFDCDARITWDDFVAADQLVNTDSYIYSFVPRPNLKNTDVLVEASMLHHAERMLVYEYSAAVLKKTFWHYPMGASMLIDPRLWEKIDTFPEPIDDIPLQYLLRWHGLHFTSLPYFTSVQAPPDFGSSLKQMVPVFKGVFSYFTLAKRQARALSFQEKLRGVSQYVFFCLEFGAILGSLLLLYYLPVYFLIFFVFPVVIQLYWLGSLSVKNILLHILGYYLRLIQFAYFIYRGVLFPIGLQHYKTERQ